MTSYAYHSSRVISKKPFLNLSFEKVLFDEKHYGFSEQIKQLGLIRKYKPDVTHFLNSNVPILFNRKFIVTIHDLTMYKTNMRATTLPLPIYYAKSFVYKKVLKHAILASHKIIVPSEFVKDEIVKNFKVSKSKITTTYEGVDGIASHKIDHSHLETHSFGPREGVASRSFLPDAHLDSGYFLYVGNAYPHKNLERAIRACLNLKVNFYIVSSRNIFTKKLEKVIKKLDADKYVKLLGFVEDQELMELYKSSTGFIFPSLSEGFGLPGLEAMKAGTVVLASDIPVFREIYGRQVFYFNPRNISSIEKTISEVVSLKESERRKIIFEGRSFIKRYSWEKMAKETLDVYNSIK